MNDWFNQDADEVFEGAGLNKILAPNLYNETKQILAEQMAQLSSRLGLSYSRVEAFKKQKDLLIKDLKELKESGNVD